MTVLVDLPKWLVVGPAVALGLIFGSFLNVVIYRLPRDENLAFPGSHCPACGASVRAYDNIPVLSWLLLRGRARCCGARISPRYPLVELLGGLLAWALVETRVFDLPGSTPWWRVLLVFSVYLALGLGLIAAAFIDLETMILPDEITLGGAALGLLSVPLRPEVTWTGALLGAAIGFVVVWLPFDVLYSKVRGHPGMGLGDAKLVMLSGAWFGWSGALFTLLAGAVQGTLIALVVYAAAGRIEEPEAVQRERAELKARIEAASDDERRALEEDLARDPIGHEPEEGLGKARLAFGPFLVLATIEFLLFGKILVQSYLAWLGNA